MPDEITELMQAQTAALQANTELVEAVRTMFPHNAGETRRDPHGVLAEPAAEWPNLDAGEYVWRRPDWAERAVVDPTHEATRRAERMAAPYTREELLRRPATPENDRVQDEFDGAAAAYQRWVEERDRREAEAIRRRTLPLGWQCPQCQRVHAPHVAGCSCHEVAWTASVDYATAPVEVAAILPAAEPIDRGVHAILHRRPVNDPPAIPTPEPVITGVPPR